MKKISFTLEKRMIDVLAHVAQLHMKVKIGDFLFDTWFYETCSEILLKIAKLRHRKSKKITVNFSLEQCLIIRELNEMHERLFPGSYENLMMQEYFARHLLRE